jgi:hypothetical protein
MSKLDKNILAKLPFAVTFEAIPKYGKVKGIFYRELEAEAEQVYIDLCMMNEVFTNVQIHKPKSYENTRTD